MLTPKMLICFSIIIVCINGIIFGQSTLTSSKGCTYSFVVPYNEGFCSTGEGNQDITALRQQVKLQDAMIHIMNVTQQLIEERLKNQVLNLTMELKKDAQHVRLLEYLLQRVNVTQHLNNQLTEERFQRTNVTQQLIEERLKNQELNLTIELKQLDAQHVRLLEDVLRRMNITQQLNNQLTEKRLQRTNVTQQLIEDRLKNHMLNMTLEQKEDAQVRLLEDMLQRMNITQQLNMQLSEDNFQKVDVTQQLVEESLKKQVQNLTMELKQVKVDAQRQLETINATFHHALSKVTSCTVQHVANSTNDAGGSTVNYGVTVTHTCNTGYNYLSPTSVQTTCNVMNQWSATVPDCQRCVALQSVSSSGSITVQRGSYYGGWARDMDGKVYWMDGWRNVRRIKVFPSESSFISNVNAVTSTLNVGCTGANYNVHDGKLYCNEHNTNNVVVIDLVSLNIVTRIAFDNVEGNVAGRMDQCPYSWTWHSDFDIESDENGLWVIWGRFNDNCNIGLSKINPNDNTIEQTWWVPASKTGTGNAFMRCGVLYVIATVNANPSYIRYIYDTATSSLTTYSSSTGIPWYNHHNHLIHAHYDKYEKVIYVWERGYQSKIIVS